MNKGTVGQGGRIRVPRLVPAFAAVLLLALGAAGLAAAKGSATHSAGPLVRQWWLFAAAVLVAGIVALVKLRERISATDPDSTAQARLNRGAVAVIAVLTAALPIGLFLMRQLPTAQQSECVTQCINTLSTGTSQRETPPQMPGKTTTHQNSIHVPLGLILSIVGILLALVIAAAVIALVIRLLALGRAEPEIGGAPAALAEDVEDESALGAAVLAGRSALEGEARAAIIACYAAMEDSLTEAGVPRLESDSPTDLLARATRRGVVDGPAPRLLATLFREARFSTHPMDARHLDQARGALDEITAQLTARQEAENTARTGAGAQ